MKSIKPLPPLNELSQWFGVKGSDLVWKTSRFPDLVGKRAGYRRPDGYIEVQKNNQKMLAHRVVYYLAHGKDPGNFFIDHVDGNPSNNDPINLRLATQTENMRNVCRLRTNNKSGQHGVHQTVVGGVPYWKASVYLKGKRIHLGSYGTKEEAIAVRQIAERFVYGDFAPIALDLAEVFSLGVGDENVGQSLPELS